MTLVATPVKKEQTNGISKETQKGVENHKKLQDTMKMQRNLIWKQLSTMKKAIMKKRLNVLLWQTDTATLP